MLPLTLLVSILPAVLLARTVDYPPRLKEPGDSYPQYRSLLEVIERWNPDDPEVPEHFHETIQMFNYSDLEERQMALSFREAELPFKLYDVPEIDKVVNLWTDEYLSNRMKYDTQISVEISKNNHFMFWKRKVGRDKNWKEPTKFDKKMGFDEWVSIAHEADEKKLGAETQHLYFHKSQPKARTASGKRTTFVGRDLEVFSSTKNNFFVFDVEKNKGIQCRFGMRGIIAESHYDAGRNMVAMLKGAKRYIINPPEACPHLGIYSATKHPSYRHSKYDWSNIDFARKHFDRVPAIDTIVQTGEVLYIPSFWFHYIISLEYSIQCNSRSGTPDVGKDVIDKCYDDYPVLS